MAENKDPESNPGGGPHKKDDEQLPGGRAVLDDDASDLVTITLRRDTALDLINALISNLGRLPNPADDKCEAVEQAGDSTIHSDR